MLFRSKRDGVSTPTEPQIAGAHAARDRRGRICHAAVEALESRTLFAAALAAGFQETLVATGVNQPTAMAFTPDGRMLVATKSGNLDVVQNGQLLPTPFLSVSADVYRDHGFVGLTLDPNFSQNGYVYVYYCHTDPTGNVDPATDHPFERLSRFKVSASNPNVADPAVGEQVLIDNIDAPNGIHDGGFMGFGADGMLYLAVGEHDIGTDAQDLSKLGGKVLRLNVSAFQTNNPSSLIPADNPFVGQANARAEIYAYGFRNPYSGTVQPGTNNIFINDVGAAAWEEVDQLQPGGNYGWPTYEGSSNGAAGVVDPLYTYNHNGAGASITGGALYTGAQFPAQYQGKYFFCDIVNGWVKFLDPANPSAAPVTLETGAHSPVRTTVGLDGSLYYLSQYGNAVYKISYVGIANRPPTAIVTATSPTSGYAPMTVSFDGSGSTDPDGDPLSYTWNFGDGSGAVATPGATVSHLFAGEATTRATYNVTLTVTDPGNLSNTSQPIAITVGNTAPVPTISVPSSSLTYYAGEIINFAGSAVDVEDGAMPAADLTWSWLFGHNTHFHNFIGPQSGISNGSFVIPTTGETDPDQYYRLFLTATDSQGLATTTYTDIRPQLSNLSLASNVAGISVNLDANPVVTPSSSTSVVGMQRTLQAPLTEVVNNQAYQFVSWSDGGAATHTVSQPTADTTITASYQPIPLSASYATTAYSGWMPGQFRSFTTTVTNTGTQTWNASGANAVHLGVYFSGNSDAVGDWSSEPVRIALNGDLAPGQSQVITVAVQAPSSAGSYVLRQRMVKEGVAWFEPLLSTNISDGTLAASYSATVPTAWAQDEHQEFPVTVTNTGSQVWNFSGSDAVTLGVSFGTASDIPNDGWASNDQRFFLQNDVPPGASVTFDVIADAPVTPGSYIVRLRMVKDNVAWFDQMQRVSVTVNTDVATYSGNAPTHMRSGATLSYSVTLTNTGTSTWNATGSDAVDLGAYFGTSNDAGGAFITDPVLVNLPYDVGPGQSVTLPVTLSAPTVDGTYVLRNRLNRTTVGWFSSMQKIDVTVDSLAPTVTTVVPNDVATDVDPNSAIAVTFSEALDAATVNTATLMLCPQGTTNAVPASVTYDPSSNTATLTPSTPLASGVGYTVRIVAGGVADLAGNKLAADVTSNFVTGGPFGGDAFPLAAAYSGNVPTVWVAGQTLSYVLTLINTGSQTWNAGGSNPVHLGWYFGALDSSDAQWAWSTEPIRVLLPNDVVPGQSVTVVVTATAPAAPGNYILRHRMVKENVAWFDQMLKTNVTNPLLGAGYAASLPTSWSVGQAQTFQVTITNKGSQTWNAGGANPVHLGVYFAGSSDAQWAWSAEPARVVLPYDLAPGQSTTLTVTAIAPSTAANYILRLRMVKEGVAWFDQIKKATVSVSSLAGAYASAVPTAWVAGQPQTFAVTLTNNGSTTWSAAGTNAVHLGWYFGDIASSDAPYTWTTEPQRVALPSDIAPGQSVTVNVTATPPSSMTGNGFLRLRMVQEGVAWFAQVLTTGVTFSPGLAATYSGTIPTAWTAGQPQAITLTLTNAGTQNWIASGSTPVHLAWYFGSADSSDAAGAWTSEPVRVFLASDVAPGQSIALSFMVTPPTVPGNYVLRFRMVQEFVGWFDQILKSSVTASASFS